MGLVVYVYCYHEEESLQTLDNILASILEQIIQQEQALVPARTAVLRLQERRSET